MTSVDTNASSSFAPAVVGPDLSDFTITGPRSPNIGLEGVNLRAQHFAGTLVGLSEDITQLLANSGIEAKLSDQRALSVIESKALANVLVQIVDEMAASATVAKLGLKRVSEFKPTNLPAGATVDASTAKTSFLSAIENIYNNLVLIQDSFTPHAALGEIGVTGRAILRALVGSSGEMMSDLARKAGVSTAAITGSVDRLAALTISPGLPQVSLVERTNAPDDRRKILAKITDLGELIALQDRLESALNAAVKSCELVLNANK